MPSAKGASSANNPTVPTAESLRHRQSQASQLSTSMSMSARKPSSGVAPYRPRIERRSPNTELDERRRNLASHARLIDSRRLAGCLIDEQHEQSAADCDGKGDRE